MSKAIATDVLAILGTLFRTGTADPRVGAGVAASLGAYYMLTTTATPFQKTGPADTDWTDISAVAGGSGSAGFFGTGGDGAVVLGAGTTTLTSTMVYESLIVPNGAVLETDGWPVYVRTTLEVQPGGIIRSNGNAAVGAVAGAQTWSPVTRLLTGGRAGGNGQTGNGSGTTAASLSPEWLSVNNGRGGNGGAGGTGSGGSAGPNNPWSSGPRYANLGPWLMSAYGCQPGSASKVGGGNGGGGGGGDGVNAGGGGGGGGGMMFLAAFELINNGIIEARGGAGAVGVAGNAGGGGGGGGGRIMLVRRTFAGTPADVSGGAGGAGVGTGVAGANGNAGYVFEYPD